MTTKVHVGNFVANCTLHAPFISYCCLQRWLLDQMEVILLLPQKIGIHIAELKIMTKYDIDQYLMVSSHSPLQLTPYLGFKKEQETTRTSVGWQT